MCVLLPLQSVVKAKLLLGHLLSLACTPTDTATLQQCILTTHTQLCTRSFVKST